MSKHIQTGQQRGGSPIVFKSGEPISVICVASTFTSLSYANNGGKVQITSSGVHGLTTSPAVGSSVYVSWVGGTGVSGLYTILSVDSTTAITIDLVYVAGLGTPTVAVAGTSITVSSINLPILLAGSQIRIHAPITVTNSANNKFFRARLNDVVVGGTLLTTAKDYHWLVEIAYRGNNIKFSTMYLSYGGSSSGVFNTYTVDTTASNILTLTAQPTIANEVIIYQAYAIEVFI